jgi:sugar (pentulose or hexulose) kinase
MQGLWIGSVVRFRGEGRSVKVVGGGSLAGIFQDSLAGRFTVDTVRTEGEEAADAYMALITSLGNTSQRTKDEITNAYSNRIITQEEAAAALNWLRKAQDGARARYRRYRDDLVK